jgi:bla regulator protein blaR1
MTALRVLAAALYGFGLSFLAVSQTVQPTALKPHSSNSPALHPTFDAASVKRLAPGSPPPPFEMPPKQGLWGRQNGRYTARFYSLLGLVQTAYNMASDRMTAADWMRSERYDVAAVMPPETTDDQVRVMLQSLLEERFRLKVHFENRPTEVYALRVGKNGVKLQASRDDTVPLVRHLTPNGFEAHNYDLEGLAGILSRWTDHPVLDMTGISGRFDFKLNWKDDSSVDPSPMLAHPLGQLAMDTTPALRSLASLGLRAERKKVPLKFLVVDHAEKIPIGN